MYQITGARAIILKKLLAVSQPALSVFPYRFEYQRQIHRITEKFKLERTSGDNLVRSSFENRALYYPEPCQAEQTFPGSPWRRPWRGPWWSRLLSCCPCKTTSQRIHRVLPVEGTSVFLTSLLYF